MKYEIRCPECNAMLFIGTGSGTAQCRRCKVRYRFDTGKNHGNIHQHMGNKVKK